MTLPGWTQADLARERFYRLRHRYSVVERGCYLVVQDNTTSERRWVTQAAVIAAEDISAFVAGLFREEPSPT
jgi:riboflavin biosynthesis pyrimidine reductase